MKQVQGASWGTSTAELLALPCHKTRDIPGMTPKRQVGQECSTSGIFYSVQLLSTVPVGFAISGRKLNEAGSWKKNLNSFASGANNALLLYKQQCQK